MKTLLLLLLTALAGCVSITYSPIQSDSPAPSAGWPPLCEAMAPTRVYEARVPEATLSLAQGKSCMFPVRAELKLTLTPLAIEQNQTYRITVPRNQVWYDQSRRNVPPHGDPGSALMKRFDRWKRHSDPLWFALIAANVGRAGSSAQQYVDVSIDSDLVVTAPGQLAFYPNDAIVPALGDYFYSNNSGQVWVQIEHCAAACSPAEAKP